MATQRLLPIVQQAASGLLDRVAPVTVAPEDTRQTMMRNPYQTRGLPPELGIQQNPYDTGRGFVDSFTPMQAGGGRFVTEDQATKWDGQNFSAQTQEEQPWYKRMMNDPALMSRLALGFNTMRLNPDAQLAAVLGERIKTAGELAKANKTSEAVIVQLKNMGEMEAAKIVEANPAVAKDVLQQIVQAKYARKASPTASGVQIDPQTGQMFQVVFDPSTQKNVRIDVEGATGETPSAAATREAQQQALIGGQKMASDKGAAVFARASSLGEQIGKLQRARDLVSQGAQTGVIRSLLPSFDAATAELRAIGNSLGIDIINSATFGALSEKELSLALSTGLDLSLSGEALQKHIQDKINAQEKLYNQLMEDARQLSSGMTYNQYIQMRTSKRRESPIPVYGGGVQLPPNLRSQMSEDEVAAFNKLPADMQQKFISGQ